jgi:hypothetical protein
MVIYNQNSFETNHPNYLKLYDEEFDPGSG